MSTEKLELGEEITDPKELEKEEKIIDEIAEIGLERIRNKTLMPRDEHPKQFGCVWAEFIIEKGLPEFLQVGVFQKPRTFPAWIRFSSFREQPDSKGDAYGMAIKLMGVEGKKELDDESYATTQDFLLNNSPVFFVKNAEDYVISRREKILWMKPLKLSFPSLNPFTWSYRESAIFFTQALKSFIKINSPLEIQYHSAVPYRLGLEEICQPWSTTPDDKRLRAVKYFVKPQLPQNKVNTKISKAEKDYLHKALVSFLSQKQAYFDFYIQLQADPEKMPIEDPRIEWKGAPEYKVATIKIPAQTFDTSPDQLDFGENLSFTPWHCLHEHRPLGEINRVRLKAYQKSSGLRHDTNKKKREEPTPESSDKFKKLINPTQ